MNRRGVLALAGVALLEIKTAHAKEKCVHDHQCGDGKVCVDGSCRDRVQPVPCVVDTDCTSPAVCLAGFCVVVEVINGITVTTPVTINLSQSGVVVVVAGAVTDDVGKGSTRS